MQAGDKPVSLLGVQVARDKPLPLWVDMTTAHCWCGSMRKGDIIVLGDSGCPRRGKALGLRTAEDSCISEKALITKPPYSPTGLVALRLTSLTVIIKSDTFLCHYLPCIMSYDFFPLLLFICLLD